MAKCIQRHFQLVFATSCNRFLPMIYPGKTLGVLGGGQLGRMFVLAAHKMGYETIVFDPDPESPGGRVAGHHFRGSFSDHAALTKFSRACDAVTVEFENVDQGVVQHVEGYTKVYPKSDFLKIAQDRLLEKQFVDKLGIPTVSYSTVDEEKDISNGFDVAKHEKILKIRKLGYDGKGQQIVRNVTEAVKAFRSLGSVPCILEEFVELNMEISVIIARNHNCLSAVRFFPHIQNFHRDGVLHKSLVPPTEVSPRIIQETTAHVLRIASAIDYCGVLCVEFFVTGEEPNVRLYVNEVAPRPHNSGHFAIDACSVSQFDLQVRTMCEAPLPQPELRYPFVAMFNIFGDHYDPQHKVLAKLMCHPRGMLHIYAKSKPAPRRKMGHFCLMCTSLEELQHEAGLIEEYLLDYIPASTSRNTQK